jgi:probable phosphoglycerate mutase
VGKPDVTDAPADAPNSASESQSDSQQENDEERQEKPPTRVLLVRHAVTAQTGPLLSGRTPGIDLSERGVEQADAAAKRLAVLPIAAVYASPIERTTQTAQKIASHHGLTVEPLPGVVEADYGDWTGQKLVDLAKTPEWSIVQVTPSRAQFPNGETIMAMQARTVAAVEQIVREHAHQTVVIVSHADPIKSAIAHFTGMHLDLFQRLHVSPASVTVLEFHRFGATLVKSNDTGGLDDLLPAPEAPVPPETDG